MTEKNSSAPYPRVNGRCPACRYQELFLGEGGFVTCSNATCPDPTLANTLLERLAIIRDSILDARVHAEDAVEALTGLVPDKDRRGERVPSEAMDT